MTHYGSHLICLFLINSAEIYGRYTEVKLSKNTFYAILLVMNRRVFFSFRTFVCSIDKD